MALCSASASALARESFQLHATPRSTEDRIEHVSWWCLSLTIFLGLIASEPGHESGERAGMFVFSGPVPHRGRRKQKKMPPPTSGCAFTLSRSNQQVQYSTVQSVQRRRQALCVTCVRFSKITGAWLRFCLIVQKWEGGFPLAPPPPPPGPTARPLYFFFSLLATLQRMYAVFSFGYRARLPVSPTAPPPRRN